MSLLNYFRSSSKKSANIAKDRLQIIVAHQRRHRAGPLYLKDLEKDIIEVIGKYVQIKPDQVKVQLEQNTGNMSVLELNVTFADSLKALK